MNDYPPPLDADVPPPDDLEPPAQDWPTVPPGTGQPVYENRRPRMSLAECHAVFRRWLGDDYDTDALDIVLAAAAVERFEGDPTWLLVVSGSGNAKTETVQTLAAQGAMVISSIASQGALLSATSKRERDKNATGGLLREIGERGILVIKDVTTILTMKNARDEVLAALREIYDGYWRRDVGTDGGRSLEWRGRLVVIGAVTTAWDTAHGVIATMGDRFVLVRMDARNGRKAAGARAIANTGQERLMREDLGQAAAGVLAHLASDALELSDDEHATILNAADIVTRTRTGVEMDSRGDPEYAHEPEMPTRFAKQLAQIVRGALAIGVERRAALRLAVRAARDSTPPQRLAVLDDLAAHPDSPVRDIYRRLQQPRKSVDRQVQALHMLGMLTYDEELSEWRGNERTTWRYSLADDIDPTALRY